MQKPKSRSQAGSRSLATGVGLQRHTGARSGRCSPRGPGSVALVWGRPSSGPSQVPILCRDGAHGSPEAGRAQGQRRLSGHCFSCSSYPCPCAPPFGFERSAGSRAPQGRRTIRDPRDQARNDLHVEVAVPIIGQVGLSAPPLGSADDPALIAHVLRNSHGRTLRESTEFDETRWPADHHHPDLVPVCIRLRCLEARFLTVLIG